jgi:phenylpropionate dioxygenase-like ring-hydroxylating dioxygenase large terminal subunit
MTLTHAEIDQLVSIERGTINRRIYSDDEIFEQEMEQIFGRAWLFLCHESQLREAGDFFEAVMGRDNVLVVRQKDGGLKALLNTCTHRGNAVCRAEEGNARSFLCTYHGWSYGIDGRLLGVPGFKTFYDGELDKSALGMREIAQLDTYKGFVFGTHDSTAPPLLNYLGATARLGIDLIASRGDMELVPGIQKFVVDCNWKFAVDNLFDWYHPQVTHASAFVEGVLPARPGKDDQNVEAIDLNGVRTESGESLGLQVGGIVGSKFDQIVILGEYGHAIGGPSARSAATREFPPGWREQPEAIEALGPIGIGIAGHPNVFPNSWITTTAQLSLRVPRTAGQTEIWWFTFVDRNATPEIRAGQIGRANAVFGPAGLLEQEDGENWAQATMQTRGSASRKVPQMIHMGLGSGNVIHEGGLARIEAQTNEHGQRWTYHSWMHYMKGATWDELKVATTPGSTF